MAAASLVMCALVAYFFLFGYSLTCSSFWNCQFGDLGYVCLGGLPFFLFFFLFGYSLMCSSFFGIANCQILVMCASLWLFSHMLQFFTIANLEILVMYASVADFLFSLSLSLQLFSHAIQLFWNSQFGEPFQVHKIFQAFQILGI